jgi:predicted nuclease of restriction endonuclease-like (RecB) superfamily
MLEKSQIAFVQEIKAQIKRAQYLALKKVNKEQIKLYWNIGKNILEKQNEFGWGKSIVEVLAIELQKEFVGIQGFSARNLWRMRTFYEQYYKSRLILPPLVAEISWTHHIIIIEKCKDENKRLYYLNMTKKNQWSKNLLINAIDNQNYENTLISQTNFESTLKNGLSKNAKLLIKDEYIFDFLNLTEPHSEAQLEQAILTNIRNFLIELGGDFTFIGNQFPLKVNDKVHKIDLLLYHRQIQCIIAIELKINEFEPEYAGKMNFYLSALNNTIKKPHENPSIGIIICKSKERTTVEFALQDINKPIGIATYKLSKNLPKSLNQFFPSNEELVKKVEEISSYILKHQKHD